MRVPVVCPLLCVVHRCRCVSPLHSAEARLSQYGTISFCVVAFSKQRSLKYLFVLALTVTDQ